MRENDIPGRYGGEEFGVILVNTPKDGAMIVAERIRATIDSSPVSFEDGEIPASASLGVTTLLDGVTDSEELIADADAALYYGKENGRNQVTHFSDIQDKEITEE